MVEDKEREDNNIFTLQNFLMAGVLFLLLFSSYKLGDKTHVCTSPHPWMGTLSDEEKQIPDRIWEGDILATNDKIVVLGTYSLAEYKNTDSMLPLLDYGSTGIQMSVDEETELFIGDVVSYRIEGKYERVVHRIIDAGIDNEGVYYILKGDNVNRVDIDKVRKKQIEKVLVGILW